MAAIHVLVRDIEWDNAQSKLRIHWLAETDTNNTRCTGSTVAGILDTLTTVNARIISDAKSQANTVFGLNLGALDTGILIGGRVL